MAAIFEADDRLAAAMAEIKRLRLRWHLLKQLAGAIGTKQKRSHQDGEVLQGEVRKGGCVTTYSLFTMRRKYATATFPAPRPFQEEAHEALRQGALETGIDVRC